MKSESSRLPPAAGAAALAAVPGTSGAGVLSTEAYAHWGANAEVVAATAVAVLVCVVLHYEVLNALSQRLSRSPGPRRRKVVFAIFGMLALHVVEIWVFAIATTLLLLDPQAGSTAGIGSDLLDQVYLSAMTFTTVGAADAHVAGPVRFINGNEALTGLMLITWSASFTYLEMARFWRDR